MAVRRTLRDREGRILVVRQVVESDASRMVRLMRRLLDETPYMLRLPEEQRSSASDEARYIRHLHASGNSTLFFAESERSAVGTLIVTGGALQRLAHVGYIGMGVLSDWWGAGVGTALLETAIDWARHHPVLRKLSLQVYENNERGLRLYRRIGFVEEGRLINEVRLDDGTLVDMHQLALFLA